MNIYWWLVAFALSISASVAMLAFDPQPHGINEAQANFERAETPKHYDFAAWRRAGDISCQNVPTLRICRAHPVVTSAIDGQPVRDFMSFACSTTECAWVDP